MKKLINQSYFNTSYGYHIFREENGKSRVSKVKKHITTKLREKYKYEYKYERKNCFLTPFEHEFFEVLMVAAGDSYYVFPQLHLSTIVEHRVVGQNWDSAFYNVNQKSVDFVLCDKKTLSPMLAIELDDSTHERPDRVERDVEVEHILIGVGLPLLRIKISSNYDSNKLAQKINALVQPAIRPVDKNRSIRK
jgi:very-short-patch-repair endonuclease